MSSQEKQSHPIPQKLIFVTPCSCFAKMAMGDRLDCFPHHADGGWKFHRMIFTKNPQVNELIIFNNIIWFCFKMWQIKCIEHSSNLIQFCQQGAEERDLTFPSHPSCERSHEHRLGPQVSRRPTIELWLSKPFCWQRGNGGNERVWSSKESSGYWESKGRNSTTLCLIVAWIRLSTLSWTIKRTKLSSDKHDWKARLAMAFGSVSAGCDQLPNKKVCVDAEEISSWEYSYPIPCSSNLLHSTLAVRIGLFNGTQFWAIISVFVVG